MKKISKILAVALCVCMAGSIGACHKHDGQDQTISSDVVYEEPTIPSAETITLDQYQGYVSNIKPDVFADVSIIYNGQELTYPIDMSVFTNDGWVPMDGAADGMFIYQNDKYGYDLSVYGYELVNQDPTAAGADAVLANGVYTFGFVAYDGGDVSKHPDLIINGVDAFNVSEVPDGFASKDVTLTKASGSEVTGTYYEMAYHWIDTPREHHGLFCILRTEGISAVVSFEVSDQPVYSNTNTAWMFTE